MSRPIENIPPLLKKLLIATDQDLTAISDEPLLKEFDWQKAGIKIPYVIFFTGRCGSTWLTSLIKNTKLAGNPEEFFNADWANCYNEKDLNGLADYFSKVVRIEQSNQRFGMEIDADRFRAINGLIDIKSLFSTHSSVMFYLYRRDILAQAWSWSMAMKSGLWHAHNNNEPRNKTYELPTTKDLATQIVRIKRNEEFLEKYFIANNLRPIYIEYESLVTDPIATLCEILINLSVPSEEIERIEKIGVGNTKPLVYDEKYKILIEFHQQFGKIMGRINRNRNRISSDELEKLLLR